MPFGNISFSFYTLVSNLTCVDMGTFSSLIFHCYVVCYCMNMLQFTHFSFDGHKEFCNFSHYRLSVYVILCTYVRISLESSEKKSNCELMAQEVIFPNVTRAWRQAFQDHHGM